MEGRFRLTKPIETGRHLIETMVDWAETLEPLNPPDRVFVLNELLQAIDNAPKLTMLFGELQIAWLQRRMKEIRYREAQVKTRRKKPAD